MIRKSWVSQCGFAPSSFLVAVNAFNGSTMFVADGYANTRVVKFNKHANYLTAWGEKGIRRMRPAPSYFNSVGGIAVDAQTDWSS